jgi:hypothetical protein
MQCFELGQPAGSPADAVRAAFSNVTADSEPEYWHLSYDATNHCDVRVSHLEGNPGQISALTVHRPCGDERLWESLYSVLRLGSWVLYFPSKKPPLVVANYSHAKHFPPSMIESLGPVCEVKSGPEIVAIIRRP